MKVKIFASNAISDLESAINDFLQDDTNDFAILRDIKYSSSDSFSEAMIIYTEKLKAAE